MTTVVLRTRPRGLLAVLLFLLPVAALIAQLQVVWTVYADKHTQRGSRERSIAQYVQGRYEAAGLPESQWIIVNARLLMRYPIRFVHWATGARLLNSNALVQCAFLWAGLCVTFLFASQFLKAGWSLAATLAAAVWLCWTFLNRAYLNNIPYDLPTVFFSASALWAIARRRFPLLVVTIALGTLNKESIVWCIPAYLFNELRLTSWRERRPWLRFAALCVLFVFVYQLPRTILASQPNVSLITASTLDGRWGRLVPNLKHLLLLHHPEPHRHFYAALALHLPALLMMRHLPGMVRAAYLATPVFLVPILLFGNIWELRLFNDLVPLGATASAIALARLVGDEEPEPKLAALAP